MEDDTKHEPYVPVEGQHDPGDKEIDPKTISLPTDPRPGDEEFSTQYAATEDEDEYPTQHCTETLHRRFGGACFWCCEACNYDRHICGGCGQNLRHDGLEWHSRLNEPFIPHPDHRRYCPTLQKEKSA